MFLFPTENLIKVYYALIEIPNIFRDMEDEYCILGSTSANIQGINVIPNDIDIYVTSNCFYSTLKKIKNNSNFKIAKGNFVADITFKNCKIQLLNGTFSQRKFKELKKIKKYSLNFLSLEEMLLEYKLSKKMNYSCPEWENLYFNIEELILQTKEAA